MIHKKAAITLCAFFSCALLKSDNFFTGIQTAIQRSTDAASHAAHAFTASSASNGKTAPQKINTEGFTPLMKAIAENNADQVKELLQKGASPIEAAPIQGTHTFINAFTLAQKGKNLVIMALINEALKPYTERSYKFISALDPRKGERFDEARAIFKQGIHVNARDKDGKTPLVYASYNVGDSRYARVADLVNEMIKMGADINILTINNKTPAKVYIVYATQPGSGVTAGIVQADQKNVKITMPADSFILQPEGPMCYDKDSDTGQVTYDCGSNSDTPIKFSSGDIWNIEHITMGPSNWIVKKVN